MPTAAWWHERLYDDVAQSLLLTTLYDTRSRFQHIVIAEHKRLGRLLILDDIVQITEADHAVYQEMMTHVPLMGLPAPARSVLVVGGGDGAMAREALRHPSVQRVVMVELDQVVIEACKQFIPSLCCDYSDPRLELVVDDANQYIQHAPDGWFDAILVDSPDPIGPAEVLFSSDFYSNVRRCLTPDGAVVCQSGVPFFQAAETAGIVARLSQLFTQVRPYQAAVPTYYGGAMALVLATNAERDVRRARESFTGAHYNESLHTAAFALPTSWEQTLLPK